MSTITKEQAQKIIDAADAVITALAGTNEDVHPESDSMPHLWDDLNDRYAPPEVVRELARFVQASLEADDSGRNPVLAYADSYRDMAKQGVESIPVWSVITDLERNIAPLYTAPPAPVSVPDFDTLRVRFEASERESDHGFNLHKYGIGYADEATQARWEAWIACRAAMLQGAEPVATAYKLPEGWVAVPVEPTEDMIVNGFESEPDESFSDAEVWEAYDAMSGCQQAAHRAKLCWAAMIAAAPKPEA